MALRTSAMLHITESCGTTGGFLVAMSEKRVNGICLAYETCRLYRLRAHVASLRRTCLQSALCRSLLTALTCYMLIG